MLHWLFRVYSVKLIVALITVQLASVTLESCNMRQQQSVNKRQPAVCILDGLEYSEGALVRVRGELRRCGPQKQWEVVRSESVSNETDLRKAESQK